MSEEPRIPMDAKWKLAWLYFAAVMLAYAIVILTARWPPAFVDYPEWVYQGVLFHGWIVGHPFAGYTLKHYPVPFSSTTVVIGLLNTFMSWQLAGKLWICVYLALAGAASWMLSRALRVTSPLLIYVLPLVFLNLEFWYGRVGFEMGMCLVMMFIALTLRGARPVMLSLLLLAIFFSHMEALACAFLFLGLWVLSTRNWRKFWVTAPCMLLAVWYAIARFAEGNQDAGKVPSSNWIYATKMFFAFRAGAYLKIFGYVNPHSGGLSQSEAIFGKYGFLLLLTLYLCFVLLAYTLILRSAYLRRHSDLKYLSAFVLILIAITASVPQVFLGSTDPGSRLALMGATVGLFLVDWNGWPGKVLVGLGIIVCLANICQFALLDHDPYRPGHPQDLPYVVSTFGHTQTSGTLRFYQDIEQGQMHESIFTTALYLETKPAASAVPLEKKP